MRYQQCAPPCNIVIGLIEISHRFSRLHLFLAMRYLCSILGNYYDRWSLSQHFIYFNIAC